MGKIEIKGHNQEKLLYPDLWNRFLELDRTWPEEVKAWYTANYRDYMIGEVSYEGDQDKQEVAKTKGNVRFLWDTNTEMERFAQYALDGGMLTVAGYPETLQHYIDFYSYYDGGRGVEGLKAITYAPFKVRKSKAFPFAEGDAALIAGIIVGNQMNGYREEPIIDMYTNQLKKLAASWQSVEDAGVLEEIARTVGIIPDDYIAQDKIVMGTNVSIGSYYDTAYLPESVRNIFQYTDKAYPRHVAVPLQMGDRYYNDMRSVITEELLHLEIEPVVQQFNFTHGLKEAVMTAALHRVLRKVLQPSEYLFWMSSDASRKYAADTYVNWRHVLAPIVDGKESIATIFTPHRMSHLHMNGYSLF